VGDSVKASWEALIDEWIRSDLPLVIRKSGGIRGADQLLFASNQFVVPLSQSGLGKVPKFIAAGRAVEDRRA